jgi:methylphosphotriester-DNA--protein-cysteine methyltransferase
LERSIAVDDLEQFAATGELTPQLAIYAHQLQLSQDQLQQVREVLVTPAELDNVAVSQFLYTEQGKLLLKQLSQIVQTPSRQAGFSAISRVVDFSRSRSGTDPAQYFPAVSDPCHSH